MPDQGVVIIWKDQERTILFESLDVVALMARVVGGRPTVAAEADELERVVRAALGLVDPVEAPGGGKDDILMRLAGAADGAAEAMTQVEARRRGYAKVTADVGVYLATAKPADVAKVAAGDFSEVRA